MTTASSCLVADDPLGDLHIFWANIFMTLVPSAEARAKMRLRGISQRLDSALGWYLWREGEPGAYALEAIEARFLDREQQVIEGQIAIRYYPALENDPAFPGLSAYERECRCGDDFDETGTPTLEAVASIAPDAFLVGSIKAVLSPDSLTLLLEGQKRWQTRGGPPEYERNVPGWEKAWSVFDSLVMAWCMFFTGRPLAAGLSEGPGLVWEWDSGVLRSHPAADNPDRHLFVALPATRKMENLDPFAFLDCWSERLPANHALSWLLVQPPAEELDSVNREWWQVSQALGDVGLCCLQDEGLSAPGGEQS